MALTVLVVDDDADIRAVMRFVLEDAGYRVLQARNGLEALESLSRERPQLILLDLNMPVMDGVTCFGVMKASAERPPVVFVTAAGQAPREAARHGADGYLEKPFELSALTATVQRYATQRCP